jgi:hypothetical protein
MTMPITGNIHHHIHMIGLLPITLTDITGEKIQIAVLARR